MKTTGRLKVEEINLSDPEFWEGSRDTRFPAFDVLRRERPVAWQPPPLAWAPTDYPPPEGLLGGNKLRRRP